MPRLRTALWLTLTALLAGCATDITPREDAPPQLVVRNLALNPRNGGLSISAYALRPGDILLSSADGLPSLGVRLLTLSSVSHASLYLGDNRVAEAVGRGIQTRSVQQLLDEESTVVAFRHPRLGPDHAVHMQEFARAHAGHRYDFVGVLLHAPFSVERRLCELPLVPAGLRDFCLQGIGAVQLGIGRNDRFFCSQFVLEAFRRAGLPLTDADPRLLNPADLLHMREGDVPSVRTNQALRYVGHLKFRSPDAVAAPH